MRALDRLRENLRAAQELPPQLAPPNLRSWEQLIKELKSASSGSGTNRPPSDRIRTALLAFHRHPELGNAYQSRLICFGCLAPDLPGDTRLIEDASRFPRLLDGLAALLPMPRIYRRCYLGLLHAYFTFDGEAAEGSGSENWQRLRRYLQIHLNDILVAGSVRQWVVLLQENEELLGEDPAGSFGQELLAGRSERFDLLCGELAIGDASWLIRKVVLAQVTAATCASDAMFVAYVPKLLELLESHPHQRDYGLATLLRRYHAIPARELHAELRSFAVRHWKNPWFQANDGHWSRVEPAVRTMIKHWVNLDLIRQFFSLLATGDSNDKRRLAFWEKYHDKIDDIYFALGDAARLHKGADYQEIRRKMSDRRLKLYNAGSPENNAFIMCIGSHVVVEFGKHGNACYIHKRDRLPFKLTGEVAGDSSELRHDTRVKRLIHRDSKDEKWEQEFERTLRAVMYEGPAPGAAASARAASGFGERTRQPLDPPKAPLPLRTPPSIAELRIFCFGTQRTITDLRSKGGCLWVQNVGNDHHAISQLKAWGFQNKPDKGWWLKD